MRSIRILLACLAFALSMWAQADANRGQIIGTVYDPNQAVVPQAAVRIRSLTEGTSRDLETNEEGIYRAVQLTPGRYELRIEKEGFAPAVFTDVVVNVGASVELNATLQVGTTAQTVEVGETLLQVNLPMPTVNVDTRAITDLPILGRRFQDFATLTPTVQIEPSRQQLSFVGQRGVNSNVMLDGTDYNQPFFGGIRGGERSNFAFTIPQSAIQEFQTVTTGYAAEYGRSTGGVLNAITKSGTNAVNGEAFYQVRHKELSAANPIFSVTPNETLQQFGGAAGGPFVRDKWFWFAAAEQQITRIPRQVFFAALTGVPVTPANQEAISFLRTQEVPYKQTNDATAVTGRTDYQFTAGHRLGVRYNHSRNVAENGVSTGGSTEPNTRFALSNEGTEEGRTHTGTVQYTHLFSPAVVNDTRFSYTFEIRPRDSNSELPNVSLGPIGGFGSRDFLPTTQDDSRIQIIDTLSMTRGAHTFKFGFDYSRLATFQSFGRNYLGAFNIAGSNVNTILDILTRGGTVADRFDSRDVTYRRQIGNTLADFGMHQIAGFAQDSWRALPSLTLDFGFRWEGQLNPTPEANNTVLVDLVRNTAWPNGQRLDPASIPDSLRQFMPRFGFAWTPLQNEHRTVVRGHTGIFYAATPMLIFAGHTNNFRTPPGNVFVTLQNTAAGTVYDQLLAAGVDLNSYALGELPVIPIDVVTRAAAIGQGVSSPLNPLTNLPNGASIDVVAPDFRNPRSFQAGLGVETEITGRLVGGIQLNYVNTVNLHRNRDYNLPAPTIRANDASRRPFFGLRTAGRTRPVAALGEFTARESSARSMYRGATTQIQYRGGRVQFGAFYTLSETFSDSDLERDAGGVDYANAYDFSRDYNYSRLDARHQFTSNGVVSLPLGFELSGIFRARSGLPLNATTGGDENEDLNTTNDRPLAAPGVVMERNSFRNRGTAALDMRLLKNFRMGEQFRLQISAEVFNVLNSDNVTYASTGGGAVTIFGPGITTAGAVAPIDARFRRLTLNGRYDPLTTVQVGTPRQAQFGLRFFF